MGCCFGRVPAPAEPAVDPAEPAVHPAEPAVDPAVLWLRERLPATPQQSRREAWAQRVLGEQNMMLRFVVVHWRTLCPSYLADYFRWVRQVALLDTHVTWREPLGDVIVLGGR